MSASPLVFDAHTISLGMALCAITRLVIRPRTAMASLLHRHSRQ